MSYQCFRCYFVSYNEVDHFYHMKRHEDKEEIHPSLLRANATAISPLITDPKPLFTCRKCTKTFDNAWEYLHHKDRHKLKDRKGVYGRVQVLQDQQLGGGPDQQVPPENGPTPDEGLLPGLRESQDEDSF